MAGPSVVVVGGGFAGVACAHALAKKDIPVTLVDRNNYHQFQPLLYQVASAQIAATDIARPLRSIFRHRASVTVRLDDVAHVDPAERRVSFADGSDVSGDYLVLAAGARPNFFGTPGAEAHAIPLYSLEDAERLRTRLVSILNQVDADHSLVAKGALNYVVVGGGPTGVETAGAIAEILHDVIDDRYAALTDRAQIHLVDRGTALLAPFSDKAHAYVMKVLERKKVTVHLGMGVAEVREDGVVLTDGTRIVSRVVVWAGGEKAAEVVATSGLPVGHGDRVDVRADLSVVGMPNVFVLGDAANITDQHGVALPQLGSVAQQSGEWAAKNILADLDGKDRSDFRYLDKGIMAMIGRDAAVAEVGKRRHEIEGVMAFAAWLGVHAALLSGVRNRIDAFVAWGWDYFSKNRAVALIDNPADAVIDWGDDPDDDERPAIPGTGTSAS